MTGDTLRSRRFLFAVWSAGFATSAAPTLGQLINEDHKLLANDGAASDEFGYAIAIDSGIVVVGAQQDDDNGFNSGSVYLFNAFTGARILKLLPIDGASQDKFGYFLDIDNGIVAVGALEDDDNGSGSGSAYLFDAFTGTQIVKLLPTDGSPGDHFGWSIAIDNGIVAVGAVHDTDNGPNSGSAYLFDATTGAQICKLLPNDGNGESRFGQSIAIDSGIVAVGAWFDTENGKWSGAAYLFNASTGAQIAKLLPTDGSTGDMFGISIAIDHSVVAVGSFSDDDNGSQSGSAYLFDTSTGSQIAKLLPLDGSRDDQFGRSIAIDNGIVAVGAWMDNDNGTSSGSAYLFDAFTGAQIAKLLPSDGAEEDQFVWSIAIDNGIVAVGARWDDDNGTDSGSAYVFDVNCHADLTGDGVLNFFDVSVFLNTYNTQDPIADFNDDGVFDFFDVQVFLTAFAAGCPLGS